MKATKFVRKEQYLITDTESPEYLSKKWYLVDAKDQTLGRLSSRISLILRGKNKPTFTPHVDTGDNVIVINAEKIKLTGNKWKDKVYYRHTGYQGGLKAIKAQHQLEKDPTQLIRHCVKGMLPKTTLGRQLIDKLKIYKGTEHPHTGQTPETITLNK